MPTSRKKKTVPKQSTDTQNSESIQKVERRPVGRPRKDGAPAGSVPTKYSAKKPPAQIIKEQEKELTTLKEGGYCYMCDTFKPKSEFYVSTDPRIKSGVAPVCKECAKAIAFRKDKKGDFHDPTKESLILALRYLDKPFVESVYDRSVAETQNLVSAKVPTNFYYSYMRNIQLSRYVGMTYADSDFYREAAIYDEDTTEESIIEDHVGMDTYDSYIKNKNDVIRLLNYDPFEKEPIADQPFLYSQLLGLLDHSEDANEDMIRISSCVSIVRGFLQASKIDDTIAQLMSHPDSNSATIRSLQESKAKVMGVIKDLAAESCISLKNNKNAKRGDNTWTGRIKRIKDINLREGEVNGFDIETCKGMQQVMDLSNASILKQLRLDESEYSDMVAEQREMITKLTNEKDNYKEVSRILLRENTDLRDTLEEEGLLNSEDLVDLDTLFSPFSEVEKENDDGWDEDESVS